MERPRRLDYFNELTGRVDMNKFAKDLEQWADEAEQQIEELKDKWEKSLEDSDHLDDAKMYFNEYIKQALK